MRATLLTALVLTVPAVTAAGPQSYAKSKVALNFSTPTAVVVGDVNNDGRDDFATLSPFSSELAIAQADGTFVVSRGFGGGTDVAMGDLNGDGNLDIAIIGSGPFVRILYGNGDGTFDPVVNVPGPSFDAALRLVDFSGDGRLDIVAIGSDTKDILGIKQNAAGAFGLPTTTKLPNEGCTNTGYSFVGSFDLLPTDGSRGRATLIRVDIYRRN